MFWCEMGHVRGVETARLDGSERRSLSIEKVYRPQALALDLPVKRLYIADMHTNSMHFCTYDGLQCHQVLTDSQVVLSAFSAFLCFD